MAYRINLYPAGIQKREARSGRIRHSAVLTLVAGVQVLLLGLFVLSSFTVREQAATLEKMAASNQERVTAGQTAGNRGTINQARQILQRKADRRNWTNVLYETGHLIQDQLILDHVEGSAVGDGANRSSGLTLTGRLRSGSSIDPVVEYARKLNESPVYRAQFEEARVDRMDNSAEGARFLIQCPFKVAPGTPGEDAGD